MLPAYAKQLQIIKNDEISEGFTATKEGDVCQLCRIVDITDERVNDTIRKFYEYVKKQMVYCGNQAFCEHVARMFNKVHHLFFFLVSPHIQAIVKTDKLHCKGRHNLKKIKKGHVREHFYGHAKYLPQWSIIVINERIQGLTQALEEMERTSLWLMPETGGSLTPNCYVWNTYKRANEILQDLLLQQEKLIKKMNISSSSSDGSYSLT